MYDIEKLRSVIREVVDNRGIDYTEDEQLIDFDSLQFINMIVEFEETLNITIEDNYLTIDRFSSFVDIESTLVDILKTIEFGKMSGEK